MDLATLLLRASIRTDDVVNGGSSGSLYGSVVPNLAFNVAMLAIWGVLLGWHTIMFRYKQYWFSSAFVCAAILQVLGYVGRVWGHFNLSLETPFVMQQVCLTVAPVFTMRGVYYQLPKMIEIYGHQFSLLRSPIAYWYLLVAFDLIALPVQAAGGAIAGTNLHQAEHILIAGFSLQVASMVMFMALLGHLYYKVFIQTRLDHSGQSKLTLSLLKISQTDIDYLYRQKFSDLRIHPDRWVFRYFPVALVVAVATVFVRCCYRLAVVASDWQGSLIKHENYFIILDAVMVAMGTVALSIFHPGFAFQGTHVSIPITHGRIDPETDTKPLLTPEDDEADINSGDKDSPLYKFVKRRRERIKKIFNLVYKLL
ncbi:hypothetical protein HG537_0E03790 [Torulaspora globosa]|uniref:Sphingoid long-chain base transporter RSB1 n=1 Tax=Torulaspora globosa TaxID=48254 RepID=A0A7H9HTG3_9SACH|nr:hypothetical protein HG537_0E03790 [Torulaspora sp. CBS 2947]